MVVITTESKVQIIVNIAVQPSDQTYLESPSTILYASKLNPTGNNTTLLCINASEELSERAKMLRSGNRQIRTTNKHMKAMTQSPTFVTLDFIMINTSLLMNTYYQTPRSPLFLAMALAVNKNITQITD